MSFGLKGKIKESVLEMQTRREGGENISLHSYMRERFPDASVGHLYSENNLHPQSTTVDELMKNEDAAYLMVELARDGIMRGLGRSQREQLQEIRSKLLSLAAITTDPNFRSITPEQFLDPIRVGQAEAAFYNDLIMQDIPVNNLKPKVPKLDLSNSKPKRIREGSKIELGTVSYGEKEVTVNEYGLGIEFTYNSLKYNVISLVPFFFEDLGGRMGALKNDDLAIVSQNGDQPDGSESSAVIGVETVGTVAWKDVVRVFNRMKRMGRIVTALLAGEEMANDWENMSEVKNRTLGNPLLANRRTAVPQDLDVFIAGAMAADQLQFIAPALAFLQLTAQGVMVETDKIISKRLEEAYVSEAVGFMNFQRDARITLDKSIAYSSNPFPTWFNVKR
jgi:hypothetical protein